MGVEEKYGTTTRKELRLVKRLAPLTLILILAGCSVVMEATRPTPVDLTQFHPGESRDDVVGVIGAPTGTVASSVGEACDAYELYTHGYGAGGKVGIAVLEGAADVFTIGLAEAVTSPVEGATRNQKHTVLFCYKDSKLARLKENGQTIFQPASTSTLASATLLPGSANSVPSAPGSASGSPAASTAVAVSSDRSAVGTSIPGSAFPITSTDAATTAAMPAPQPTRPPAGQMISPSTE